MGETMTADTARMAVRESCQRMMMRLDEIEREVANGTYQGPMLSDILSENRPYKGLETRENTNDNDN